MDDMGLYLFLLINRPPTRSTWTNYIVVCYDWQKEHKLRRTSCVICGVCHVIPIFTIITWLDALSLALLCDT